MSRRDGSQYNGDNDIGNANRRWARLWDLTRSRVSGCP